MIPTLDELLATPTSLSLNQAREQHRNFRKPISPLNEVRSLEPKDPSQYRVPESGFFDDEAAFFAAVEPYANPKNIIADAVYSTFNEVEPSLLALAKNRMRFKAKVTTSDDDVTRRRYLLIDIDPTRKGGISATPAEREDSLRTAHAVVSFLSDTLGLPEPALIGSSGNGAFGLYRIDLPNDDDATDLVKRCLKALQALFGTPQVTIDQVVSNPARIMKIPGTITAKGDPLGDRTYRFAYGFFNHNAGTVSVDQLESLAAMAQPEREETKQKEKSESKSKTKTEEPRTEPTSDASDDQAKSLDRLTAALTERGIGYQVKSRDIRKIVTLDRCLTSDAHTTGAAITVFPSGAYGYGCRHNSCAGKKWEHVREQLGFGRGRTGQKTGSDDPISIPIYSLDELSNLPGIEWLIKNWLPMNALGLMTSDPGVGKTFIALYIAFCVALGLPVFGSETRKGDVVILSGEGTHGIMARLNGLSRHLAQPLPKNLFVIGTALDLVANVDAVAQTIRSKTENPVLIIEDTQARYFNGNENDAGDMGRFVNANDRLKDEFGASILLLHHLAKNGSYRGSSAIDGAIDARLLRLPTKDGITVQCEKQRPGKQFAPLRLKPVTVQLSDPTRMLNIPVGQVATETTIVYEVDQTREASDGLSDAERTALQTLADHPDGLTATAWKSLSELPNASFYRTRDVLMGRGFVDQTAPAKRGSPYWITDAGKAIFTPKATVSKDPFGKRKAAA